ncbi:hypothetical protein KSP40_PGU012968 [Platanthera guangdongensis]|uniref:Uncharacterized protein n=1 Tax=Platanthera guangdongensis TaxID=2320717 RepID=A0ABR2MFM7_9ASPA
MRGGKGRTLLSDQEKVKLGFPLVLLISSLFFFAGFYVSMLVSQELWDLSHFRRVSLMKLSEADTVETETEPAVPRGVTGDAKPYSGVPFQILSWMPRAIYFPKFATPEECHGIVKISRSKLSPSTLAFRDGDTVENTKGIRTRNSTFSATKLGRGMLLIMTRSTQMNMAIRKSRG